tara:strand:- start:551 stop:721 length:171 start_codon:yes stop_codon:yes gene_type:complete
MVTVGKKVIVHITLTPLCVNVTLCTYVFENEGSKLKSDADAVYPDNGDIVIVAFVT